MLEDKENDYLKVTRKQMWIRKSGERRYLNKPSYIEPPVQHILKSVDSERKTIFIFYG